MRAVLGVFLICSWEIWALQNQHQYTVYVEDFELEYLNKDFGRVEVGLEEINKTTKGINIAITLKRELPDNTKAFVKALKWFNNGYKIVILQLERRVKDGLDMDMFDIQNVCLQIARPPLVWPLQKNVTYRLNRWVPDSTKYPPNVPEGKWKFQNTVALPDKTKLLIVNWYNRIEYNKEKPFDFK